MKQIIKGKMYDTEKARRVADYRSHGDGFRRYQEALYCKRTGEYFLHGEGGPMTKYATRSSDGGYDGDVKIIPLTYEQATAWAEDELDVDAYEAEFGAVTEEETVHMHISLPAAVADRIRKAAQAEGVSVSECIGNRF